MIETIFTPSLYDDTCDTCGYKVTGQSWEDLIYQLAEHNKSWHVTKFAIEQKLSGAKS